MTIHTCPECQLIHDHPSAPAESAEVAIARIQADAAIRQAEINARADRSIAETHADADVQVAEAEAEAVTEALADEEADQHVTDAIQAAAVGLVPDAESAPEPAPEMPPVIQVNEDEHQDAPPPAGEHHEPPEPKRRGLGMWG